MTKEQYRFGKFVFIPNNSGLQRLNAELATDFHSELHEKLSGLSSGEVETLLPVIATHCGMEVDGWYDDEGMEKLCGQLLLILISKRKTPAGIILQ